VNGASLCFARLASLRVVRESFLEKEELLICREHKFSRATDAHYKPVGELHN
jgi:hypothetical protein